MPLQLFIGNKNYSSWSMRPWVLMRQAGIPFDEVLIRFDSFEADSEFKRRAKAVNPLGKVPALVDEGFAVWDSLAIAEYLAERFPDKGLWPADARQRARARSVCAEMHSGFSALRNHCPMNIEASLSDTGALLWRDQAGLRADVARIEAMWGELLATQPADGLLFGGFTIADAFFAPVCTRIRTYGLPVSDTVRAYVDRVLALPGVKAWIGDALAERDFIDFDEPYRLRPATR
ncbi:MAG: glutathione S-transferase [Hydrogenophaga sp.]|uniref:glutathione S-transferase family protein n=1 Tax=Hydrogenophaga sp. TaxID=1904254 RepID=UPI001696CE23|nr:glutathione S-transferase family protein [Hydrogenophaga sp.]NIM40408.1 glutathione S-transferase [Hydrogenophaga sp.]NIN25315.1 glutathione S-transferase [Hydrogenophaga sp.]NIN29882.1 glutathione S-transferase [Hydrogenophaga sp.]NIN54354.1 glutathione S-transferase [Hydrogenophaga sp.]NIO52893.1 glutathione S-transferase [Hydrogenophaga sp.]